MSDIAAAILKVQHHYAARVAGARRSTEVVAAGLKGGSGRAGEMAETPRASGL